MTWLRIVGFLAVAAVAWFFLSGEEVGSVRGTMSGPWGTDTPRVTVRRGGGGVRIATIGVSAMAGVWLSRAQALQCADALEKAAHEAVS